MRMHARTQDYNPYVKRRRQQRKEKERKKESPKAWFQAVRFSVSGRKCPSSPELVEACRVCQPMHVLSFVGGRYELFVFWGVPLPVKVEERGRGFTSLPVKGKDVFSTSLPSEKGNSAKVVLFFQGKILVNFWCTSGHRGGRKTSLPWEAIRFSEVLGWKNKMVIAYWPA